MFYSHQLLARKAYLGQIWMAAKIQPTNQTKINRKKLDKLNSIKIWMAAKIQPTNQTKINRKKLDKLNSIKIWRMQQRINRKKLDKLNSIKICEEILNPSVPMALRLSGILKGGVVIVYEPKVKLLFDDVSRLLVEINEAWKIKALPDPTVLPKGKSQAKYEAVTVRERMMGTDGLSGRSPRRTGLSGRTSTLPGPGPNEPSKGKEEKPSKPEPSNEPGPSSSQQLNKVYKPYFVFVMQLGRGFRYVRGLAIWIDQTGKVTIHGFWPHNSYYSVNTENLDEETVKELELLLSEYWPSFNGEEKDKQSYFKFWTHQWNKHGRTSGMDKKTYFRYCIYLQKILGAKVNEYLEKCTFKDETKTKNYFDATRFITELKSEEGIHVTVHTENRHFSFDGVPETEIPFQVLCEIRVYLDWVLRFGGDCKSIDPSKLFEYGYAEFNVGQDYNDQQAINVI